MTLMFVLNWTSLHCAETKVKLQNYTPKFFKYTDSLRLHIFHVFFSYLLIFWSKEEYKVTRFVLFWTLDIIFRFNYLKWK